MAFTPTTAADIRSILEVPGDISDASLDSFAADANLLVGEELVGLGLSDARLSSIAKYIGAHLSLMLTERGGLTSSKLGDSQDNYTSLSPLGNAQLSGFQLTRYGQQALLMDTSGTLLGISKGMLKAKFTVSSEFDTPRTILNPWWNC